MQHYVDIFQVVSSW